MIPGVPHDPAPARLLRVDERWRFTTRTARPSPARKEPLSAATAGARLDEAVTRDEVVACAARGLASASSGACCFFIVKGAPGVLGWSVGGEGVDRALVSSLKVLLDQPSIFRTVTRDRSVFIGRLLGPEGEPAVPEGAQQSARSRARCCCPSAAQPGGEPRLRRQRRHGPCPGATWD